MEGDVFDVVVNLIAFAPVPLTFRVGELALLPFVNFTKIWTPVTNLKFGRDAVFATVLAAVSQVQ